MTTTNDRIHVLHVDNKPAFDSTATELPRHNDDRITFYTATTPNEGLTFLSNHDIDCIVSEYDMPGRDGLSFLEAVRKEYPSLPFIFYTNEELETVVPEALSTGSTDYVPKGSSTEYFQFLAQRIIAATEQQRASDLKRIAALVRDIQSDLVQARTRDDIETSVCERLIDVDPYVFAWIGGFDADTAHVTPRASAGEEEGYLDIAEITVDNSTTGQGPTGQAIKTRSTQVVQDISADPTYDPWREAALERSYQSSAAIPIEHDGTLYGVLNVYAAHPNAFDGDEQSLLEDLSDTIAHAYYHIQVRDQYHSQYQELFENAPVMMVFTREANGEPIIEDCNQRFANKLGYSREELLEQPLAKVYTETSTERLLDKGGYQRSLEGEFTPQEREFVTADDERLVTLLQATPRRNEEGDVIGTHTLYVDITDRRRAQSVLEQAEAMEASMDGMAILDEDGEFVYVNQAHADIYGYDDPEALIGNMWRMLHEDDEICRFENEIFPLMQDRGRWRGEATGRRRDDETFQQDLSLTETDNGGLVCVVRDITDRKERERQIEELKERLELAIEGAGLGVWDWDMTTDEVEFNEQWAQMLGYSLDEIEPHLDAWEKRVHPDDLDAVEEALDEHIAGETELYDTEHRMRTADGDWKWIRDIGKIAERDEDGEPVRAVGIHLDIDDRKTYERQLAEKREMFTQGPAVVFKWREAEGWSVEHVSENVEEVLGYTADELQSGAVQFSEIIHEEDRERVMQEVADNSTEGTEQFSHEPYRIVTPDGAVRWVLDHTRNIWKDGEIINRLGYLVDITEQRQNEIYLQNAQKVADIGWWQKEIPSDEIYWSEHVYDIWEADGEIGYLDHERVLDFIHPEDTDRVDQAWQAALDGEPYDIEHRIVTGDGEVKWMREVAEFTRDETDDPIEAVGIVQDITERKERERELEYYERVINTFGDIATVIDSEGEITYVSPSVERVLGYDPEDLIGQNGFEYQPSETVKAVEEAIEYVIEYPEESQTVQTKFRRADGSWCWIEATIQNQLEDDLIEGLLVNSRDITERKEYEQTLEEQRDNLEILNQIVRHDVRNQLQFVLAYGDMLEDYVEDDGEEYLRHVLKAGREAVGITQTAGEITEAMLSSETDPTPVNLRPVLEAQIEHVRENHERAVVSTEGSLPDVAVLADDMLESVFRNLLNNAIVHNDKELPEVTVSATTHEEVLRFRIADNGPGIPDQQKDQIFNQGEKGLDSEGTGIGLYLVQTLVDRYGGAVWVEDNDPEGSVFIVELRREQ